jgi:hypothetical protein
MCPEDQKASRNDSTEQETVVVSPLTNYEGYYTAGKFFFIFKLIISFIRPAMCTGVNIL